MDDRLSQYSDSPSVYARPFDDDHFPEHVARRPSHGPASMLDLDDDPRSPYADTLGEDDDDDAEHAPDDAGHAPRLSYLGPKMRFHSRAPWEMDGEPLAEEDEDTHHLVAGLPFGRSKHGHGAASPRPSFQAARPSGESSRSTIPPKRSFETINSQMSYPLGALYTLAQESMSATALARPKETLRSKFSLGRLRPDAPAGSQPPPPLPPSSPARSRFQTTPPPFDSSVHPYANPDNAAYTDDDDRTSYPNSLYAPSRNDSSMTVTETFSGDSFGRASARSAAAAPTLTPDTSLSSLAPRPRPSAITAKSISAPLPVTSLPEPERADNFHLQPHGVTLGASLPGWHERGTPPAFSLISLEEARAQRMRSVTAAGDAPRASSSSAASQSQQAHLSASYDDGDTASILTESSPFGSLTSRARGRSISAGAAKAKNALHTIVGQPKNEYRKEIEPPLPSPSGQGKTLKHKKSGFMRLFNAGKAHDRDDRDEPQTPPPVPALPEHTQLRPTKPGIQRIPVPSLSASLVAAAEAQSADDGAWSAAALSRSPKRAPPTLSITTVPTRGNSDEQQQFAASTSAAHSYARPWATADQQPQSAPAHVTSFPALRLRPVSTLFSAHFGEHIVPLDDDDGGGSAGARSSGDTDADAPEPALDTPRSSSPGVRTSPLVRASSEHSGIVDGGALGAALHAQQILNTKSAEQRQIRELEGRVRDLQAELDVLRGRNGDAFCVHCGRGKRPPPTTMLGHNSVVNRPRARTGTSSRFGSALP